MKLHEQFKTKYEVGQKVYAIFGELKAEQIEIHGFRVDVNFEQKNGDPIPIVIYKDHFGRYVSELRCFITKDDLINQFKENIKML